MRELLRLYRDPGIGTVGVLVAGWSRLHEDLADGTKRFSFCAISYCAHKTPPLGLTSRDANHDAWIAERTTPVATVEQEEINTGRTQLPRES
jgi:hypothetical protein